MMLLFLLFSGFVTKVNENSSNISSLDGRVDALENA